MRKDAARDATGHLCSPFLLVTHTDEVHRARITSVQQLPVSAELCADAIHPHPPATHNNCL